MSSRALQDLFQRLNSDPSFSEKLRENPTAALASFDLSTSELFVLSCGETDALRRLLDSQDKAIPQDLSYFADAFLPAYNTFAREEYLKAIKDAGGDAGTKTSKVTSSGVTTCCWG